MEQNEPNKIMPPRPGRRGRRVEVEYKGKQMMRFRAERIRQMKPLIERANSARMTIPAAAKWLGYSETALRAWIRVLKMRWRNGRTRKVNKFDKTTWEHKIRMGFAAGKTQREIAYELQTGPYNVSKFMKEIGIVMPSKRERIQAEDPRNGI